MQVRPEISCSYKKNDDVDVKCLLVEVERNRKPVFVSVKQINTNSIFRNPLTHTNQC